MTDTPKNTLRNNANGKSHPGDLSGNSEMFVLRNGERAADNGTRMGPVAAGRGAGHSRPADASSRQALNSAGPQAGTVGIGNKKSEQGKDMS
jgi:hypothetical protein